MLLTADPKRVGPVIERECGYCEGVGQPGCPSCDGTGRIGTIVNPFAVLESAVECIQALRTCMGLQRTEIFEPKVGTPAYYADAVEDYLQTLFQQLVVMLPEEHERTEGG